MLLRILGWVSTVFLLLIGLAAGGVSYYVLEVLPSMHEPPKAIVHRIPEHSASKNFGFQQAYSGSHPSQIDRPSETYSFPIAVGEIGPQEPLFAGPMTYPLWCGRNRVSEEQPLIDNQEGFGVPVFEETEEGELTDTILGYSKDCVHPTRVRYFYLSAEDQRFYPLDKQLHNIEKISVKGRAIDFVVRVETGTINRHFYAIAALRGEAETLERPAGDYWNGKLIYQFRGGVGIGKRQGNIKPSDVLKRRHEQLKEGYAVVYSSANQTSNHYNMWLAEDTALRVKRQFVARYGEPIYTVGIGGSGGAIQQYLLAQNNDEILDGLIPLYSYPDMVSQTIYVLDCEPLEYYFDVVDAENTRWQNWSERVLIEGLNSSEQQFNKFTSLAKAAGFLNGNISRNIFDMEGASECVQSWRGLTPLIHNPNFVHFSKNFSKEVQQQVHWTHWEDLSRFYGRNSKGYAQSTWDNVGVQYGLQALIDGQLTIEDFLKLNRSIGGWTSPNEMIDERFWFLDGEFFPIELSVWSHQNLNLSESVEHPAPRTTASLDAIQAAYRSGHVFLGRLDLPILDVRHYLEDELDMHHASASFMTRERMIKAQGHADNHVVWMSHPDHNPINHAFAVMDEWLMARLISDSNHSSRIKRPLFAMDTCFDAEGEIIARGEGVWDGYWNQSSNGVCTAVYPSYPTSREIAGAPISGDVFKCERQTVKDAIRRGVYEEIDVWPHLEELEATFPQGVCDYRLADAGRPQDLLAPPRVFVSNETTETPVVEEANPPAEPVTLSRLEAPAAGNNESVTQ